MGSQAFLKKLTLPLVQRNLIGASCDAVPKRLDAVNLVFDRELVES